VVEEARVALGEQRQVVLADSPLVGGGPAPHPLHQRRGRRLQVDDQIRGRRARPQHVVDLAVQREFVLRQREPREQRILVEQEVADRGAAEHVGLGERLEHARALKQEKQLRRQCEARHVLVEAADERIVLRALEHQVARQARAEAAREGRLAGADRPLDHQVAESIHRSFLPFEGKSFSGWYSPARSPG